MLSLSLPPACSVLPGEADPPAVPCGVTEDACGDDLAEGLQHGLQLLLVHGHRQVGDVQVGGVLFLLLWERDGQGKRMSVRGGGRGGQSGSVIIITMSHIMLVMQNSATLANGYF